MRQMHPQISKRSEHPGWILAVSALILSATTSAPCRAASVMDLGRLKGSESNMLMGMGLVVGLNGTGDGGKYSPAMRSLRETIAAFIDSNVIEAELKDSKNVALVMLRATVPPAGAREGDALDVHVSSVGAAKSLRGGQLIPVPLVFPRRDSPTVAMASGPVELIDEETPQVGIIRASARSGLGAKVIRDDLRSVLLDSAGRMTFVLDDRYATWAIANNVANVISEVVAPDGPRLANAVDAKNIVIDVPHDQRIAPAALVAAMMSAPVDPAFIATGARVYIDRAKNLVIFSDDVQISPSGISIEGYRISTIDPPVPATPENPQVTDHRFMKVDPHQRGGQRLRDLIDALEELRVPSADILAIVKNLHDMGRLHAELIERR